MGTKADRNSGISGFVLELLNKDGLQLYEKWFEHLQQLTPDQKVPDIQVRDQMVDEIVSLASEGNSLILGKKDKTMVEELVNRFLKDQHLLKLE
jgi:hypothetical protein